MSMVSCSSQAIEKERAPHFGISPDASVIVFTATAARSNPFKDLTTLEQALDLIGVTQGSPIVALTAGQSGKPRRLGRVELRYLGFVDRSSLARCYSAADLYVHAARAEVQPLSLIEALASGLPAVASAVGGIPDVVRHGETGLLVPPGDPVAMAGAIRQLLDDAVGRAKMGDAAAFDARRRFSHAEHVAAYLRVYDWQSPLLSTHHYRDDAPRFLGAAPRAKRYLALQTNGSTRHTVRVGASEPNAGECLTQE